MGGNKPLYYVDSSVFIAWIAGEPRSKDDIDGMEYLFEQIDSDAVNIITSTITRAEVLDFDMPESAKTNYTEATRRSNVVIFAATKPICQKAHDLICIYKKKNKSKKKDKREKSKPRGCKLKMPDAIHLATAILHSVTAFYVFDDDLESMSQQPGVDRLLIKKPKPKPQLDLGLRIKEQDITEEPGQAEIVKQEPKK